MMNDEKKTYSKYTIDQLQPTTWKIIIPSANTSYSIILYGDGTAEIEHQYLSWSQFLATDLSQENNLYPWRIHE